MLAAALVLFFEKGGLWAFGLPLFLTPFTYLVTRWEINRWYRPKQRALVELRDALNALQSGPAP